MRRTRLEKACARAACCVRRNCCQRGSRCLQPLFAAGRTDVDHQGPDGGRRCQRGQQGRGECGGRVE
eukprot:167619-Chlamydomonas_euryale.AAC.1